jgi:hypothetical protein
MSHTQQRGKKEKGRMDEVHFPDVFADAASLSGGPFGVTLTFYLTDPDGQSQGGRPKPVARIRVSPDLARTLGQALAQPRTSTPSADVASANQ